MSVTKLEVHEEIVESENIEVKEVINYPCRNKIKQSIERNRGIKIEWISREANKGRFGSRGFVWSLRCCVG